MTSNKPTRYADHPLTKYVRSLDGDYLLTREVAELVGCTKQTLTDIARRATVPLGPTHRAAYGGTVLHLYTRERVEQIAEWMAAEHADGRQRPGPTLMWTPPEAYRRRRAFNLARISRDRAVAYRAAGKIDRAAVTERRAAKIVAQLEKERIKRRRQVHGVTPAPPPKSP